MASFIGTNQEFKRFIGPRLRNLIQQITKNHKAEVASCEHCGSKENLESAHVHGRDRNEIIDLILTDYTNNGVITVELSKFEEKFIYEHHPLEKSILILCKECHGKYDSYPINKVVTEPQNNNKPNESPTRHNNPDIYLPITLEPPDPKNFKKELLISKKAIIETTYFDGRVESRPWDASRFSISSNVMGNLRSRPEYRAGNWQTRGIKQVHVKVVK